MCHIVTFCVCDVVFERGKGSREVADYTALINESRVTLHREKTPSSALSLSPCAICLCVFVQTPLSVTLLHRSESKQVPVSP